MQDPSILIKLGITGHKDLGLIDGSFQELVYLGPLKHRILTPVLVVITAEDPQLARYKHVKKEIKKWHKELDKLA